MKNNKKKHACLEEEQKVPEGDICGNSRPNRILGFPTVDKLQQRNILTDQNHCIS